LGQAAHAVAAGAGLGAVVVVDAHIAVGTARARGMERHQLVVGYARRQRGGARLVRADDAALPAQINDHDLVAETVHLDEAAIGERGDGPTRGCRVIWVNPTDWPAGQRPAPGYNPVSLTVSAWAAISRLAQSALWPILRF